MSGLDLASPGDHDGGPPGLAGDAHVVARAARIYFVGTVLGILIVVIALALRVSWLGSAGAMLVAVASIVLVLGLRPVIPDRDPRLPTLITGVGLGAAVVSIIAGGATLAGLDIPAVAPVSAMLNGAWLLLIGFSRPRLPDPLPRRARAGGAGSILAGVGFVLDPRSVLLLIVAPVALVLSVSALGFVFGLVDLDRPPTAVAQ